jgi:hypothetical protein
MKFLFLILVLFLAGCASCPTEETCLARLRRNAEMLSIQDCLGSGRIAVFDGPSGVFKDCREIKIKEKKK